MLDVAPLVGAWIEICYLLKIRISIASLLSWERGLKSYSKHCIGCITKVAPLVGAWIEIKLGSNSQ